LDQVQYWDVFPKNFKVSKSPVGTVVPLSVRGLPKGTVQFESVDQTVATVDQTGLVTLGLNVGSTVIVAYDSEDRTSARYVIAEVVAAAAELAVA
jgi:hypothetical protein